MTHVTLTTAEKSRRYKDKDPDAYRLRKAEYAKTPEERARRTNYMRGWRERNPDKVRKQYLQHYERHRESIIARQPEYSLKSKYGLTLADCQAMIAAQGGGCGICGSTISSPSRPKLHVDHCHTTGRIRGMLCSRCNGALGWFEKYRVAITVYADKTG